MKTKVFALGLLIPLTACLKQNYPLGNNNAQSNTIKGAIVMRDWHGKALESPQAHVLAQFVKPAADKGAVRLGLRLPELAHKKGPNRESTQCEVIREPKPINSVQAKDATVSVGKVLFGTNSDNLFALTEGDNHLYQLPLQSNFAPGIYVASVEGTQVTPSFAMKLSMPEIMSHVLVAGQDFETSATAFRKNESLRLSWDAPTGEFDLKVNQMELEITSETEKETVSLVCAAIEKDLMSGSTVVNWEIPSNYLQALDATTSGLVVLKRGQWMRASNPDIGVVSFEGVRIYATPALIAE